MLNSLTTTRNIHTRNLLHKIQFKQSSKFAKIVYEFLKVDFFAHDNYRVLNSTKIGFLKNASNRFGSNIHIQYYNTRLNIN